MRRIGTVELSSHADRFCDYLLTQGVVATVDPSQEGDGAVRYGIWVKDESRVGQAREALAEFQKAPNDPRFEVSQEAAKRRAETIAENQRRLKNLQAPKLGSLPGSSAGDRPVIIIGVIIACVIAGFATNMGRPRIKVVQERSVVDGQLVIKNKPIPTTEFKVYDGMTFVSNADAEESRDPFASIRRGEVWRLLTPALLHNGMVHLAMNMLGLFVLGGAIERSQGRWIISLLLVVTALAGTVVQAVWPESNGGGPNAVGASGAAYGLLGYIWIRPFYHDDLPISLPPSALILALMFLLLGVASVVQGIANGAHVGGLVAGMVMGRLVRSSSGGARTRGSGSGGGSR
jgi:GlpG protein